MIKKLKKLVSNVKKAATLKNITAVGTGFLTGGVTGVVTAAAAQKQESDARKAMESQSSFVGPPSSPSMFQAAVVPQQTTQATPQNNIQQFFSGKFPIIAAIAMFGLLVIFLILKRK